LSYDGDFGGCVGDCLSGAGVPFEAATGAGICPVQVRQVEIPFCQIGGI
jgi:hypothetical protein